MDFKVIKKIWHDPVWSNVIASLIFAGLGIFGFFLEKILVLLGLIIGSVYYTLKYKHLIDAIIEFFKENLKIFFFFNLTIVLLCLWQIIISYNKIYETTVGIPGKIFLEIHKDSIENKKEILTVLIEAETFYRVGQFGDALSKYEEAFQLIDPEIFEGMVLDESYLEKAKRFRSSDPEAACKNYRSFFYPVHQKLLNG